MKKTFTFKSCDGVTDIYCVKWEIENPRAILQVSHGMSEFIDRYDTFAEFFNERGFVVVGNDDIGHGKSLSEEKAPMYFGEEGSWKLAVEDLHTLYKMTKKEYPDVPYFVLGLSLGAYLMRTLLIEHNELSDGLVLLGTSRVVPLEFKMGLYMAEKERKKYGDDVATEQIHDLTFGTYNKRFKPSRTEMDWLCGNEEALDEFIADERRGKDLTVGLFRELLSVMLYAREMKNIEKMNKDLPVLFLSGEEDAVGKFTKGVISAYNDFKKCGIKDVEYKIYPGDRHDILNEKNKEEVFMDIANWLDKKMNVEK